MSRIGKKPIPIPKGVTAKIAGDAVEVQGPKGKMRQAVPPGVIFAQDKDALIAKLEREDPELGKFHGLARSLIANANLVPYWATRDEFNRLEALELTMYG